MEPEQEDHREQAVKRAAALALPYRVVDGFMGAGFAAALHAFACRNQSRFEPAEVTGPDDGRALDPDTRRSLSYWGGWDPLEDAFRAALRAAAPEWFAMAGIAAPEVPVLEMHLAAHRDGDFFRPHVDLFAAEKRRFARYDRLLTAVYYFAPEPRGFGGGELALLSPFGATAAALIEPRADRLVVFPSFAPHEVRTVTLPGDAFAAARFSVNAWLGRARG